jgi:hypothetical protein
VPWYAPPPPFVTIEGQLHSVRTVINMLHFAPPFINTMYVTTWPISKRENKWEMLSYEAWTDERTAVCHNKPVCWRAYANERPIHPRVPSFWFFAYKLFSSWIWLKYCLLDLKQSINQSINQFAYIIVSSSIDVSTLLFNINIQW